MQLQVTPCKIIRENPELIVEIFPSGFGNRANFCSWNLETWTGSQPA